MSKPSYEDLLDVLKKVYKTSKVESAIGIEWVNYPIEVFDEIVDIVTDVELHDKTEIELQTQK